MVERPNVMALVSDRFQPDDWSAHGHPEEARRLQAKPLEWLKGAGTGAQTPDGQQAGMRTEA